MAMPQQEVLEMLLPKGIVSNTAEIYAEVASYPVVPPEKICEYWRVYTTTFAKLVDPTANRLENFWWHVWGSDRRFLNGKTLAKIYEEISTGPTWVPLKGPANRYEGPPTPDSSRRENNKPRKTQRHERELRRESSKSEEEEESEEGERPPSPVRKERTSSSAKPPPTHSILKKPSRPSSSGPRPTARFVSPQHSGDEANKDGEDASSGSTAVTSTETYAPSVIKSEKKPSPAVTKKFVASSSASKRRPGLVRRPSSQSSTSSEVGSRDTISSSGSRYSGPLRTVPPIAEHVSRETTPKAQASSQPPPQIERPVLSAKAAGKRPAVRPAPDKRSSPRTVTTQPETQAPPLVVQAAAAAPKNRAEQVERTSSKGETPRRASQNTEFPTVAQSENTEPKPHRSTSQAEQSRLQPRGGGIGRAPPQGLISSSIAATSRVAAQGTFDSENPDPSTLPFSAPKETSLSSGLPSRPSAASLLEPKFTPTQPSPTAAVPFGRSKSQLTLLLEREKARDPKQKPTTDTEEGDR